MTLLQFIIAVSILFVSPYIPALIAIRKTVGSNVSDNDTAKTNYARYFAAEAILGIIVFCAAFFLATVAPFNGLIDESKLFGANEEAKNLAPVWDFSRYACGAIGIFLSSVLFFSSAKCSKQKQQLAKFLMALALLCLLYGVAVPFMMSALVGAIRDAHLIN